MNGSSPSEKQISLPITRNSKLFRQFKNPPQPHMCIEDSFRNTHEKLYINVLGWQKIANPKQCTDPIPLYGGMQVPQSSGPRKDKPPLTIFSVMVNPDILRANGKNAANATDREALVNLMCDFVEAMNPGLSLARKPVILKDKDVAGELKDIWLAVQTKRDREKGLNQDVSYKVYDIDGVGGNEAQDMEYAQSVGDACETSDKKEEKTIKNQVKSSKVILMNAGQKSEFDKGMNNCQINLNTSSTGISSDTTFCTPVYGQIVSSRENHIEINELHQNIPLTNIRQTNVFRKENLTTNSQTSGWDEFSKKDLRTIRNADKEIKRHKIIKKTELSNVQESHNNFFPVFENKAAHSVETNNISNKIDTVMTTTKDENGDCKIINDMHKLVLHATENNNCDKSVFSSVSS